MRVFGAATGMGPVAALLFSLWIAASPAPALAIIPGRDAPVTVETICNPKPDAADILLPLPCDLTLALRAVDTPGGGTYFIGKYEISRYQWDAVMTGKCEALSTGPGALPLREVTPSEIRGFLDRYNAWLTRERKSRPAAFSERAREAGEARLPTEAEWEFAARGGLAVPEAERTRDIPPEKLREFGVISDPIPIHEPERIGMRLPNALGIYDMVGNVKEMVASASDSLIAFRGGSYKHNPGEIDIGRHDEITAINERGAERAVSDLGLRLAFSAPGYSGDPAAAPEPAGGGVNLPLALALSAAAFAAGGILVGLVVWFYQRRRLGMPVEEELALQEDLSKWQHGYAKARTALIKALKEVERRKEAGLAVDVRLEETSAALAQTLKEAAAVDEARRAAEARAEAAERRAEKAAAHNETITRAAEEQIRQAQVELEELRKRAEESEQARQAAEEEVTALREQRDKAQATYRQAVEQAESALAHTKAELENVRKIAEEVELARKQEVAELARLRETVRQDNILASTPKSEPEPKTAPQTEPTQSPPSPISTSEPPKTYTNSIGMEFVLIPAGRFWMGSSDKDSDAYYEKPQHEVRISRPFLLGKYPVTQAQWQAVMGNTPSSFNRADYPVEGRTWDDAQEFIRKLNTKEGHSRYRLPTEAEWEYACRAGTTGRYYFGDDAGKLGDYAWYNGNSGEGTHPVGQKRPNSWGLYDMYGNVWEWMQDRFGNYPGESKADPQGPLRGLYRVLRGGCFASDAESCRSANRLKRGPGYRLGNYGFRLALNVE